MCGIFAYLLEGAKIQPGTPLYESLLHFLNKIQHRGPDNTQFTIKDIGSSSAFLGFHRLAINGLTESGNQPMTLSDVPDVTLICNGEIYNHAALATEFGITETSGSDCEIIIHLYKLLGFSEMIKRLDGYFAIVLIDQSTETLWAARDPIGIRSMFYGEREIGYTFASELKAMSGFMRQIQQFPPGHYWDSKTKTFQKYSNLPIKINHSFFDLPFETQQSNFKTEIKTRLINAVRKRFMTDRPFGCLLSGGLDSSLITAIVNMLSQEISNKKIRTFSVGLAGSTDLKYARMVADYLGTDHTELVLTEDQMLAAIPEVVYKTETYDTTTVRASTPMYLLCQWIKKNTDIAVIFSGEGSDEASGSYLYFHKAPSEFHFEEETQRLIQDLSYFDVLRCDKCTAGNGLEVRVPFLDRDFIEYYMSIPGLFKMVKRRVINDEPGPFIEKMLLREAFSDMDLLPEEVLWRQKEGMSDGVSSQKRGWFQIIQEHVSHLGLDIETYDHNQPLNLETHWYRQLYDEYFPDMAHLIPYYWLPKWSGNITDPSARVLNVYKTDD